MIFRIGDKVIVDPNDATVDEKIFKYQDLNGYLIISGKIQCDCRGCEGGIRFIGDGLDDDNGWCRMRSRMKLFKYRPESPKEFKKDYINIKK